MQSSVYLLFCRGMTLSLNKTFHQGPLQGSYEVETMPSIAWTTVARVYSVDQFAISSGTIESKMPVTEE